MKKYDWLLDYKETFVYNFERNTDEIVGYPVLIQDLAAKGGVHVSWHYTAQGKTFRYNGIGKVRERNFFVHSRRADKLDEVMTIVPVPSNYKFDMLWGIAAGTSGGFPTAFTILWASRRLSIEEAKAKFQEAGLTKGNSLFIMDYNPDELNISEAGENMETRENKSNIIKLDQTAYENNFLENLKPGEE